MRSLSLFFAFAVYTVGIPPIATANLYSPCNSTAEPAYRHDRRQLLRRQFVGVQVIPGQGSSAPPPSTKYIISGATIQQNLQTVNSSVRMIPERFVIQVANASTGSRSVTCSIYWNAALAVTGDSSVAHEMDCESFAFCALLEQQVERPSVGFYLYIALPNSMDTMAAWMVKDLRTAPRWAVIGTPEQGSEDWKFNGTAALNRMPAQALGVFIGS